jgi:RNA polymerase sigma factor for flagellar operon FliA
VIEEVKKRKTPGVTTRVVESGQRAARGKVSVRRRAECPRRDFNRDIDWQKMLVELLPLVKRVALKIRERLPAQVELDDLSANGVLGLVDAVAKFDASKRVKLETYARHRVRGAILDGLRAADPASRDLRLKNKMIQKLYRELEAKVGRPVQDEEMAAASGVSLGQWHSALTEIQSVGIDCGSRVLSAGPTTKLQSTDPELLIDGGDNPFDMYYRREQREILNRAIAGLPERERQVISLHSQGLTMKQIAQLMHVDESRVSQVHSVALVRLKASVNSVLRPRQGGALESGTRSMTAGAGG